MMIHSYNNKGRPDGGSSLSVFIGISLGISFLLLFLIILIVLGITLKKKQGEKINLYWLCIHASYEAITFTQAQYYRCKVQAIKVC